MQGEARANAIDINSSAKRTSSEAQEERARKLKEIEKQQAADRKAAEAELAAKRKAEEKARKEAEKAAAAAAKEREAEAKKRKAEQDELLGTIGTAAVAVGGQALGKLGKDLKPGSGSGNSGKGGISGKTVFFAVLLLVIIALLLFLAWPRISAMLAPEPAPEPTVAADLDEDAIMQNTTADINEAILGEARQKRELVVWEQDVEVTSEVSQALANINAFRKTKTFTSFGTGVYTVDMGQITEDTISVDQDAHTVTMLIPHAQLQYVTTDLQKTEFQDTQHHLRAFGDVKLTQEQQNLLERSIEDAMRAELETDECFADADAAALLVVYDVYAPLVTKIDPTYTLEVQFAQ